MEAYPAYPGPVGLGWLQRLGWGLVIACVAVIVVVMVGEVVLGLREAWWAFLEGLHDG